MNRLTIDHDFVTFMEDDTHGFRQATDLFFGNAIDMLQAEFPNVVSGGNDAMARNIASVVSDESEPVYIWGFREYGGSLLNMQNFIGDRNSFAPTMQEAELLRISLGVTSSASIIGDGTCMTFERLASVSAVLWAVLYFHAFHGQKLTRCKHCGRWFATDSLKNEYCRRTSPCYGVILKGKTPKTCKQAVDEMKQKCQYQRTSIAAKARQTPANQRRESTFLNRFLDDADRFKDAVMDRPTPENLTAYYEFLRNTNKAREWTEGGRNHGKKT